MPPANLLLIDLNTRTITSFQLPEETQKTFIGGSGVGSFLLYNELPSRVDPLGSENILLLLSGPFAATTIPCSGRTSVITKSPLTGLWGESDVGGIFGEYLRTNGWDGVMITGRAAAPCYLLITETQTEIRDASTFWGEDTYRTHELLREQQDAKISSLTIGRAGENQVLLSSIVSDGPDARVAARGGMGAVMGSKLLKAVIVTKGSRRGPVHDRDGLSSLVKQTVKQVSAASEALRLYGTSGGVEECHTLQDMPVKNWQQRSRQSVSALSGEHLANTILAGRYHCSRCPIGCGRVVQVQSGQYRTGQRASGPEYETIGSLGTNLLIDDLEAVAKANDLCNRYGMDTISIGQVIGFAIEASLRGYIPSKEEHGLDLNWGNGETLVALTEMIGEQQAIGKTLGKGIRLAYRELGINDESLDLHVKGMELPSHDPRAFVSIALGYATSPRGACHLQAYSHGLEAWFPLPELGFPNILERFSLERKAELTAVMQNLMCIFDSLKLCKFLLPSGVPIATMVDWLNLVTGWDYDQDQLLLTGERIFNQKRLFNLREGIAAADSTLPVRLRSGPGGIHLGELLQEYYHYRGWTDAGEPTRETLSRLGLNV